MSERKMGLPRTDLCKSQFSVLLFGIFLVHLSFYSVSSTIIPVNIGVIISDYHAAAIQNILNFSKHSLQNSIASNLNISFEVVSLNSSVTLKMMEDVCQRLPLHALIDLSTKPQTQCLSLSLAQYLGIPYSAAFPPQTTVESCALPIQNIFHQYSRRSFVKGLHLFLKHNNFTADSTLILYDEKTWDINSLIPSNGVTLATYFTSIPENKTLQRNMIQTLGKQTKSGIVVIAADWDVTQFVLKTAEEEKLISSYRTWLTLSSDLITEWNNLSEKVYRVGLNVADINLYKTLMEAITSEPVTSLGSTKLFIISAYDAIKSLVQSIQSAMVTEPNFNTTFLSPNSNCNNVTNSNQSAYQSVFNLIENQVTSSVLSPSIRLRQGAVNPNLTLTFSSCQPSVCSSINTIYQETTQQLSQISPGNTTGYTLPAKTKLTVLAIPEPPFVFYENGKYFGYSVAVLDYIAKKLNYEYVLVAPMEATYGARQSNGSWNGIIGQIASKQADVALGPISVTSEREVVVDFTIPYYDYAGLQILMKKQTPEDSGGTETGMFFFVTVFSGWVWVCVGGTLIVTGCLVTLFDKLSPYSFQNKNKEDIKEGEPEGKVFSLKESMWFVLGAYTQAGESFDPRATSTRLLVAGFWIFACIMMALYTANLAAFLTVSKLSTTISTVRQLAAQTDIKYTVQKDTIGYTFFERMQFIESKFYDLWRELSIQNEVAIDKLSQYSVWEYPIEEKYTDMFTRMTTWGYVNSTEDALRKIRESNWAIFSETPLIKYYMGKDCNLVNPGEVISSRPYGIVLQNNSPLTTEFNTIILEMQRDRVLETYKVHWWEREKVKCPSTETSNGIKLETLGGVFVFLSGGIGIGFILLIIEILVAKIFGTERFKDTDFVPSHLAPHPAISLGTLRRQSLRASNSSHISISRNLNMSAKTEITTLENGSGVANGAFNECELQSVSSLRNGNANGDLQDKGINTKSHVHSF